MRRCHGKQRLMWGSVHGAMLRTQWSAWACPVCFTPLCMRCVATETAALVLPNEELERLRRAAAILDPELIKHAPDLDAFDPAFKSPCWQQDGKDTPSGLRCLPAFYVTGMFHGGGLSLSNALARHPNVAVVGLAWLLLGGAGAAGTQRPLPARAASPCSSSRLPRQRVAKHGHWPQFHRGALLLAAARRMRCPASL